MIAVQKQCVKHNFCPTADFEDIPHVNEQITMPLPVSLTPLFKPQEHFQNDNFQKSVIETMCVDVSDGAKEEYSVQASHWVLATRGAEAWKAAT